MNTLNNSASREPVQRKAPLPVFLAAVIVLFFSTLSVTDSIGLVPYYIDGSPPAGGSIPASRELALSSLPQLGEDSGERQTANSGKSTLPAHIKAGAIGLDLPVQNPNTRDIAALDALLVNGPVRYVDSARLGAKGNMIIFAHSSNLPIVRNKMFQAFNRVSELEVGDIITIEGQDGKSYLYSVTGVERADVEAGAYIDLSPSLGAKLTLVTCDTLTGKSARYILEADFVGVI
ncbi:MAG: sortase [Patescibacteria group bacterium]|nr:sortase [Patescibacteria group bacterium]